MDKEFLEDSPLQKCDSKHFGLDVSLTHLKKVIEGLKAHTKKVIAIYAPWGYGKSSLINCLKEEKQGKEVFIFDFS
ncbi:MAG: hypothetical protein GXO61_03580, partial [Epsilonproteobacteria bacterium]|nr:hypothetical protein [Campylobacterota bacterium]